MFILVFTILFTMSFSFACSILEACLLSLSTTDIAKIHAKRPSAAIIWSAFKDDIQRPIAVILIVNTLAHTIGASLSGAQFIRLFGPRWIPLFSFGFSLAMIQWTEILPKTLGVRFNKGISIKLGRPLRFLITVFTPLVALVRLVNRPFEKHRTKGETADELGDILYLARFAYVNRKIPENQADILMKTARLGEIRIRDIMVKKADIKFLSTSMSFTESLIEAHKHHHTRLPLIDGTDSDNVIGYVNFKDIVSSLQVNPADPSLRGICRPILAFDENDSLSVLMNAMTKSYQHIAVVKKNGTELTGMVTLEDLLEAIVGDIHDEYDLLPTYHYPITDTRILCGGGVTVRTLREVYSLELPEVDDSMNDWLLGLTSGRIPGIDESITYAGIMLLVRKTSRSKIFEIIIEKENTV